MNGADGVPFRHLVKSLANQIHSKETPPQSGAALVQIGQGDLEIHEAGFLDGFAAEAERLQGMAHATGDGLAHSLAADLRQLEEGIRAERVRFGKWMEAQKGQA